MIWSHLRNALALLLLITCRTPSSISQESSTLDTAATLTEIRDAIDWSKLPLPAGAKPGRIGLSMYSLEVSGNFQELTAFFQKNLPSAGWKEDQTPIPGIDQKSFLFLNFDKGGIRLSISGYRLDPAGPVSITISNLGNVDLRKLAKPADAKFLNNGRSVALYTTASSPEQAADFCRKALEKNGWKEAPADSAIFFAKQGRILLRFLQNAMEISVISAKNASSLTEVTISSGVRKTFDASEVRKVLTPKAVAVAANEKEYLALLDLRKLPLIKDAKKRDRQIEPIASSTTVQCQAPGTLEEVILFYRKQMVENDWREVQTDTTIPNQISMLFEKQGYRVAVGLSQKMKEDVQIGIVNQGNVDLRQLPYPSGTEIPSERADTFNSKTTLSEPDTVQFFKTELKKLGWQELEARGRANYQFFQKASLLRLEIQKNSEGVTAIKISTGLIAVK